MLSFGGFFIGEKRIGFILSSPKWIDDLLSINYSHSQSDEKSLFKTFSIFEHPYLDKRYRYRQYRGMNQFHLMSVVSYLYILGRGAALG